jgi:hypothetical protein
MTNTIAMVAGLATPFVTGYQSFMVCRNSCHLLHHLSSVFFVTQTKVPDVKVRIHHTHSPERKLQLLKGCMEVGCRKSWVHNCPHLKHLDAKGGIQKDWIQMKQQTCAKMLS